MWKKRKRPYPWKEIKLSKTDDKALAYEDSGLCVVMFPENPNLWAVIHIKSNRRVCTFRSENAARQCLIDIVNLTDWCQSAEKLQEDKEVQNYIQKSFPNNIS